MKIGVYIAGCGCPSLATKCIESLLTQTFTNWVACVSVDGSDLVTFDACGKAMQSDERILVNGMARVHSCRAKLAAIGALTDGFGELEENDILVGLDLDDSLAPNALQKIHDTHEAGAWVTYGNWKDQAGIVNKHKPMTAAAFNDRRISPWFMTAPNTFRVGLFQLIPEDFFQWNDGRGYYETGFDGSVMYAAADLAGKDRVVGIADTIYIYNRDRPENVVQAWSLPHRVRLFAEQREKRNLEQVESFSRPDGFAGLVIEKGDASGS